MSRFGAALARERRRSIVRAVWPVLIAIVVGVFIFASIVPVNTKASREMGRIVGFHEAGKGDGGVGYYAHVELADGRRVVVEMPSRQLCLMGQRVAVIRYRVWMGTRYQLAFEGCGKPKDFARRAAA